MFEQIQFAFSVTGPILVLLLLGIYLRKIDLLDEPFVAVGNRLVFNVTLPLMLFFSVAEYPVQDVINPGLVGFGVILTLLNVAVLLKLSPWLVQNERKGVFIQGAFRGNMGIIGLALVLNAYGDQILPIASVYIGVVTVVYNIVSVWLLGAPGDAHFLRMLRNPLLIGIGAGFAVSLSGLELPAFVQLSGEYLSGMTLPLALLCIGASLSWQSLKSNTRDVAAVTLIKLVVIPLVMVVVAILLGFRGQDLGLLFLMMAAPTAAASYVMARQMTAYGQMAAEIVAVTTALSPLTITLGLVALKSLHYL
ncbi:MAG: AEC family transporter [Gammaproteobacteria bacterium]|nr:AEC family transporter [Gammaproteobacteria bacterium]